VDKIELMPCPFCGAAPVWNCGPSTYARCDKCGCEGPWNDDGDYKRAADLWNTRVDQPRYRLTPKGEAARKGEE
jgi:hypothetical protein